MQREILPKLKIIISKSNDEAKSFHDIKVRPEHIVLSMINDDDNEAIKILKLLKVDTNVLHDLISDHLRKNDLTPRVSDFGRSKLPLSDDLKSIFKEVDEECEKLNSNAIDTYHLLLCILKKYIPVTKIINSLGVDYRIYKKVIMDTKNELPTEKNDSLDHDSMDDDFNEPERFKKLKKKTDSKTPVLDNFCRDISGAVKKGAIDPVVGRTKEIKRISQILSRRKKNNPILIGEPGVGKTSIVEGLAQLIHDGNAPRTITNKKVYTLDLASIVAGTKYRGQFEERMKAILEECKANPNIILFIDELHTIIGAGNASGSLDASNIFKPALARGEIQIIGATTLDEYREHIEKDGALTRRFQQVLVEEPTLEETKTILTNIKDKYEKHHRVKYTDEAIDECVKLSHRYIMERSMPDKAIDVMDEAGAATNVNLEKPQEIKTLEIRKAELSQLKLNVVAKQDYEQAAKLRDEEKKIIDELDKRNKEWGESLDKKVTTVGVEQISEVVSMMTGIPLTKISTQESKRLMNMDKEIMGKVIGQDEAVKKVVRAIKRNRIGIKDKNKPIGSFIFLGPTGVGKTYLAKLLAEQVFGDPDALVRFDMSEYMEKHTVSRLIGSPPGYVGYDEGGQLTEKIRRKPHSVILFDEVEKAHPDIFNVLLQLLDEGQLTDGLGRKVNFKNTLVILTSNLGVKEASQFGKDIGFQTTATVANEDEKIRRIIEKALKDKFRPEFLNRIDECIIFNGLKEAEIHKIIYHELEKLEKRLDEVHFKIKISEEAVKFLAKEGYDEQFGARPLARAIQRHVEDTVADEILSDNIQENDVIDVSYDAVENKLIIKPEPKMEAETPQTKPDRRKSKPKPEE
jgi:ATP-dependent Clp protease ATP-binding subunit ClpC